LGYHFWEICLYLSSLHLALCDCDGSMEKMLQGVEGLSLDTHDGVIACGFKEGADHKCPDERGMALNYKKL
jgi:hypothetical protein